MRSQYFFIKLSGDYALFTMPETRGGGEKVSYMVPTKEALRGIIDACYFKPTFVNVIDEVKIINPICTHTIGVRALYNNGKLGLNSHTVLHKPEYLIKFHFEWNDARQDLVDDRIIEKHEQIMRKSLELGGRRHAFFGVRDFVCYLEGIREEDYYKAKTSYENQTIDFGYMFQEFIYPKVSGGPLISCYNNIKMENGCIKFTSANECPIKNLLGAYHFSSTHQSSIPIMGVSN